jgi:hypothetical protein
MPDADSAKGLGISVPLKIRGSYRGSRQNAPRGVAMKLATSRIASLRILMFTY